MKKCIIITTLVSLFFVAKTAASAQEVGFTLVVSPAQSYLKILPGNKASHTISLENSGTETLEVSPKVLDFVTDGKTGIPILLGKTEFAYLNLTDALYQPITLAPHGKAQLTLSFTVPPGAKNKEYPLSILFSAHKPGSDQTELDASPVTGSVVSNLVVLVSDESEATKKLTLSTLGAPRFVDSFSNITFAPVIKNEAYAAAIASGSATLYNWQGKQIADFPIYPDSVLGFSTRELRSYTTELQPRLFVYKAPFLLGPYKLEVQIDNSTEQILIFALPFSLLVAAGLGGITYVLYTKLAQSITRGKKL
ncbi:MAG: hypothetical protein GW947_04395 [Candidatus Pacebacteria bacterium]|nr:hypothetical protein [Candidatus Paceibacterota bacterium]PIR59643.1 MAG: hypothetical protein COU68_04510 [Candidatus Pacebacteria bacterium CG10_big_fil_rev_8_21_14_0_10_45_6]